VVEFETDYFTAVDDLHPEDNSGAGMIGTVEFNSVCFYRYANVDVDQLQENLGEDRELAHKTLKAFLQAMVTAIPSGKQNSMAAHNPPSLILVVARKAGCWSLANAFARPVSIRRREDGDLIGASIAALDAYWGKLIALYGEKDIHGTWVAALDGEDQMKHLVSGRAKTLNDLYAGVLKTVFPQEEQ